MTTTDYANEASAWLADKVGPVLKPLLAEMVADKPDNPGGWLKEKFAQKGGAAGCVGIGAETPLDGTPAPSTSATKPNVPFAARTMGIGADKGLSEGGTMKGHIFERMEPNDEEVVIEIHYSGVCHTDLHFCDNDFFGMPVPYPAVPGHEGAGIITYVGPKVTKFKVGDKAGVGCLVNSCRSCTMCKRGDEQYCSGMSEGAVAPGHTGTYGHPNYSHRGVPYTKGTFTSQITIAEHFAIKIPDMMPLEKAGPLMCAGITMFDPLVHHGCADKPKRVGIVGIGGLGQMGIRIARGMNCEVTAISRSNAKEKIARGAGAQNFVATSNAEEMAAAARSLDIILDTVPAGHPAQDYLSLLDVDGKLVILGIDLTPYSVSVAHLLMTRVSFTSSLIGGIERTQACLKFCLEKGIECDTEVIPCTEINTAFKNLREGNDSAKRYVLDMKNTIGVLCEECTPGTDS